MEYIPLTISLISFTLFYFCLKNTFSSLNLYVVNCAFVDLGIKGDWAELEKKAVDIDGITSVTLITQKVENDSCVSEYNQSLSKILAEKIVIEPAVLRSASTTGQLTINHPTVYLFYHGLTGNAVTVPLLIAVDGFSMLLNPGYRREPYIWKQLKHWSKFEIVYLTVL